LVRLHGLMCQIRETCQFLRLIELPSQEAS
jgi:hypothetical protein